MTGKGILDFLLGTSTRIGALEKNPNDTEYRALCLEWIKKVQKDLSNRQTSWHWRWLEVTAYFSTVADQYTYDLPTNIDNNKVSSVTDRDNNRKLTYKDRFWWQRNIPDPFISSGDPTLYTVWAQELRLYSVPDSAATLYMDYVKTISMLEDDDTATTEIPDKYETTIIDGVLFWAYTFDPALGNAQIQQALYQDGVQRMMQENTPDIDDIPASVSHRDNYSRDINAFPLSQDNM